MSTQPRTFPKVAEWCRASAFLALEIARGPKTMPRKKNPMKPKIIDFSLNLLP